MYLQFFLSHTQNTILNRYYSLMYPVVKETFLFQKSDIPVKQIAFLPIYFTMLLMCNCMNTGPDEMYTISPSFTTGKKTVYEMVNFVLTFKDTSSKTVTIPYNSKPNQETQSTFATDTIFDTTTLIRTIITQEKDSNGFEIFTFKDSIYSFAAYNYYQIKPDGIYSFLISNGSKVRSISDLLSSNTNIQPFLIIPLSFSLNQTWSILRYSGSADSVRETNPDVRITFKKKMTVTTNAGMFDCYVFEKTGSTGYSLLYIDKSIGLIKQEFYNYTRRYADTDSYFYPDFNPEFQTDGQIVPDFVGLRHTKSIILVSYN